MTKQERELGELALSEMMEVANLTGLIFEETGLNIAHCEEVALAIFNSGFTKFNVEELKRWLEEVLKNYDKYDFIDNLTFEGKNPIQNVLDKIKELEDGT